MQEKLNLNQQQRLVQHLSPMQVRYVKLLEMNSPEADEAVVRELEDNPALDTDNQPTLENRTDDGFEFNESAEEMQRADYKSDDDVPFYRLHANNYDPDNHGYDFVQVDQNDNLYDFLNTQIDEKELGDEMNKTAHYIVGNLDTNGYLQRPLASIVDDMAFNLGIEIEMDTARQALAIVRSLDPPGIGASNLQDCLLLQINALSDSVNKQISHRIIADFFEAFTMKHYHKIISGLKLSEQQFKDVLAIILSLNPKPGASIGGGTESHSQQVVPDFVVDIDDDDEITIALNNNIPELHIEESFDNAVKRMEDNARTRESVAVNQFIRTRYNDARDFIQAIRLRQQTLFSVMSAIVKIQKDYFLTRDEHLLKPMALKDVAKMTGYNISVISRSTGNKYVSTPWGIIPLRFFFSEGLGSDDENGERVSARQIQAALKQLIDNEDKRRPLSDENICKELDRLGFELSRRTVAKYRDRLGIPVARLRKSL